MKIEIPDYNDSIFNINLDGKSYMLRFRYNFFSEFWTLGIKDKDGKDLISAIKIVPNMVLNTGYMLKGLPSGIFAAVTNEKNIKRYDFVNGKAKFYFLSI